MKKSMMILMIITMSIFATAQEKTKQKELGLTFRNLDSFGLSYKTGSEKALWRFNTLLLSGNKSEEKSDNVSNDQSSAGVSVSFGREYRKSILDDLEFRYGADVSFSYTKSKTDYSDQNYPDYARKIERTSYHPGINVVLGLNYVINQKIVVGVEVLPSFSYNTGESVETNYYETGDEEVKSDLSGYSYGLSNTSALISIAYRFTK